MLISQIMNDYVILTESTSDLPPEIIKEIQIDFLPLKFMIGGKTYADGEMNSIEFFDKLKSGALPTTSQINPEEFEEFFSKYLDEGKDILYISFSSALSGTCNSAHVAAKELSKKYPDNKIVVVDSLSASLGEGLLIYLLAEKKQNGESLEDLAKWAEENKKKVCHWFIVEDLGHIQRGGRISKTAAFLGSILQIKPVLHVDDEGKLSIVEKVRGRQKAIDYMIDKMEKTGVNLSEQVIAISHGDCEEDAKNIAEKIKARFNVKKVIINYIGSVIGSHAGAGTLALFFLGNQR